MFFLEILIGTKNKNVTAKKLLQMFDFKFSYGPAMQSGGLQSPPAPAFGSSEIGMSGKASSQWVD